MSDFDAEYWKSRYYGDIDRLKHADEQRFQAAKEIAELRAELARVREALERIADAASFDTELELKVFARIALAAGKGEGEKP